MDEKVVFMVDLDGTMWEDTPNEVAKEKTMSAKVFPKAVEWVNERHKEGHYICFFTARWEELREVTEAKLKEMNVKYHKLLMEKPRIRHTEYAGYHHIDNCSIIRANRFEGAWTPLVKKEITVHVFDDV
ncbi:phosphoheptose isomerase [Candidatus Woesearchaeota archaeon]|nr:phosphoheptose isomerase [Candidatus Woesearchaeota archaeon]